MHGKGEMKSKNFIFETFLTNFVISYSVIHKWRHTIFDDRHKIFDTHSPEAVTSFLDDPFSKINVIT